MEFSPNILRCVLLLVAGYLGTIGLPEATRAQYSNIEPVGFNGVQAVEGKPFQAREITKIVTYGGDETKRMPVVKAHLFRDSKGRVRVERLMDGTEDPSETVLTDILVYARSRSSLNIFSFPCGQENREEPWQNVCRHHWGSRVRSPDVIGPMYLMRLLSFYVRSKQPTTKIERLSRRVDIAIEDS